ncbi:hypothetical protein B0H15DRAFT_900678 [Mycena belliarum]|uniref:BTB domain-containing protein n=1 Tax=Mycena belliarum TaxID=1033014 RepID=A0AAD6UK26_9AGAR|nr:hypothetical protein B0H15DRAFT_900678 [Mycena belliae]
METTENESPLKDCRSIPDLWFPDATLVLRAENTLFRVYPGILSTRSTVFGDMIAVPQPAQPEGETLDGHPVVFMHDSAAEVEVFLRALYDSSYFMPPPTPMDVPSITGIMRLAHKYDVPYLFRRALTHLETHFPTTLLDFMLNMKSCRGLTLGSVHDNLITIHAASEVGATWLLPSAYYSTCTFSVQELLTPNQSWAALSIDQQQTCLAAQAKLSRATARIFRFLRDIPAPGCSSMATCQASISEAQDTLENRIDRELDTNPLAFNLKKTAAKLCGLCRHLATERCTEAQDLFWQSLPGMLGLSTWDDLRRKRGEVLDADG